jgi:hypothetical protein
MHTEISSIDDDDMPCSPPFWCVVRHFPNLQTAVIAQFDSRNAAEDHLQFLIKMSPNAIYDVVFDFSLT